jgi:dolichyl-phosphate beta-glucosyltransferase
MASPAYSIIVPAYNESRRIMRTLDSIEAFFMARNATQEYSYEIIIVDDGSTDATAQLVQERMTHNPHLQLLSLGENRGKGYAVKAGMDRASGKALLFMDADNAVDINHLDTASALLDRGYAIAIGSIAVAGARIEESAAWYRRTLGRCARGFIRLVFHLPVHDTQRGFKLFKASAARTIFSRVRVSRFAADIEILLIAKKSGFQVCEFPVHWINPAGSKVTIGSYLRAFIDCLIIVYNGLRGFYNPSIQ